MHSRFNRYSLVAAFVLSTPLFASAEAPKRFNRSREARSPQQMFDRFDEDGDGRISRAEAPERMQMRWDKIDVNADGYWDADEHTARLEHHRQRSGEKGARSGKGRDQFRSERRRTRDGEGPALRTDGERKKRPKRGGCKPRGAAGKGRPGKKIAELFDRLDPAGETPISKDALPERMQKRFERMDADGDGFLDQEEQAAILDKISRRPGRKARPNARRSNNGDHPIPFPDL